MSLLHRNLVAAAFQEMLKKIEPIAAETAEVVLSVIAPKVSPIAGAAIEAAEAIFGSDHIAAGVAAASAPPAALPSVATPAAPAPAAPAAPVNLSAGPNQAVLAAVDALGMQLSQIATQLAALRSNIAP
jgi:hypothetical protein